MSDATAPALSTLLQHPKLWRARSVSAGSVMPALDCGNEALSKILPDGGWPQQTITELLFAQAGIGELSLLLPTLAALTRQQRWCAVVAAPYLLQSPALQAAGVATDYLLFVSPALRSLHAWAIEQVARSGLCPVVIGWLGEADLSTLRRLQLAAQTGQCSLILLRPLAQAVQPSSATLRLQLRTGENGLHIDMIKARGRLPTRVYLPLRAQGLGSDLSLNLRADSLALG